MFSWERERKKNIIYSTRLFFLGTHQNVFTSNQGENQRKKGNIKMCCFQEHDAPLWNVANVQLGSNFFLLPFFSLAFLFGFCFVFSLDFLFGFVLLYYHMFSFCIFFFFLLPLISVFFSILFTSIYFWFVHPSFFFFEKNPSFFLIIGFFFLLFFLLICFVI